MLFKPKVSDSCIEFGYQLSNGVLRKHACLMLLFGLLNILY